MHPATKAALAGIVLVVLMMLLLLGWVQVTQSRLPEASYFARKAL